MVKFHSIVMILVLTLVFKFNDKWFVIFIILTHIMTFYFENTDLIITHLTTVYDQEFAKPRFFCPQYNQTLYSQHLLSSLGKMYVTIFLKKSKDFRVQFIQRIVCINKWTLWKPGTDLWVALMIIFNKYSPFEQTIDL